MKVRPSDMLQKDLTYRKKQQQPLPFHLQKPHYSRNRVMSSETLHETSDAFHIMYKNFKVHGRTDKYMLRVYNPRGANVFSVHRNGQYPAWGYIVGSAEALGWCQAANKAFPKHKYTASYVVQT
jgi:hypothetical protein